MSTSSILSPLFRSHTTSASSAPLRRSGSALFGWLGVVCACLGVTLSAHAAGPVFNSAIPNRTVLIDEPTDANLLNVTDADTPKLNLVYRGLSSNTNLVTTNNIFFGVAVGEWYVTVTPQFGQTGTNTITVIVTDGTSEATNSFLFTVNPTPAAYTRFVQTGAITIPSVAGLATNASPYPSTNLVSGMTGLITNMTLTFSRFSHSRVQDVNMLLVAPNGVGVVLFSEISGANRKCTNVTVRLADGLTYPLPPDFDLWSEELRPADFQAGDDFPGATWTSAPVAFSSFNGASPNGTWKLYVNDDTGGNDGVIAGGWSMKIATGNGPSITDITNRSIAISTNTGAIPFVINDPDTTISNLVLTASSSNTGLVPTNNIVFGGGTGTNRTVTVTPNVGQSGSATITVTVSDGTNSASDSFVLAVGASGNPPTFTGIPNKTTLAGRAVGPFNITIGDVETSVGNLVLTGSSSNTNLVPNGNIIFFNNGVTTLTVAPADGQTGTATITVNVMDQAANITSTTFDVIVSAAVSPTGIFDKTNSISIPAGSSATTYPSTVVVSNLVGNVTQMTLTLKHLTHPTPYDLEMLLVGPGGQKSVFFSRVSSNAANDVTVTVDDTATYQLPPIPYTLLTGTYSSADFGHGNFPAAPVAPYAANMSTFVGATANGNWLLYARNASNGVGAGNIVGGWSLAITTTGGSSAPTISDIANQTILVNSNTGALPFVITDSDTAVSTLVLMASSSNTNLVATNTIVFGGGTGTNRTVTVTPKVGQTGTSTITIFVSDGTNTVNDTFLLTVNSASSNNPPTFTSWITNLTTLVGRAVGPYNIGISDGAETPVGSLTLTGSSSNTNLVPNANILFFNSGVTTFTVAPADGVTGTAVITVNVSDGTNTTSTNLTLTVNSPGPGVGIFDKTNAITLPFQSVATTYPSTNVVSGLSGVITNVTLTLKGFTHTVQQNLEVLLVGPAGQKAVLQAHVGGGTANNINYTLDDAATYFLPPSGYAILPGTYRPTDVAHDTFPSNSPSGPPSGPYATNLATFVSSAPNGNWLLYVMNDPVGAGNGSLNGGWSLAITTVGGGGGVAPVISDIPNQTIEKGDNTGPLGFTISDADNASSNLVLTASSSNTNLVSTSNIVFGGGTGTNRTVTVTPFSTQTGSSTISVTVSDGTNTANDTFLLTVTAPLTQSESFTNTTVINILDNQAASPYPSSINVSGVSGTISNVTVTIRSLNHTWGRDVNILLVSPDGDKMVVMSDAGTTPTAVNATLTFSDAAAGYLPVTGSLTNGTYRPTDYPPSNPFPAPAPASPYPTNFTTFAGGNPNGIWSLYVMDDGTNDVGTISGGWSLTITTVSNAVPTISDIANQTILVNSNITALPFTISDLETSPSNLVVTVSSSNLLLVPTNGIVLGGSGSNRTVSLTPTAGVTGTSTITITVSDGVDSDNDTFLLTVNPIPGNTPPTFSPITDKTTLSGRAAGPFNIDINDAETPNGITLTATSSNTNLVPVANIIFYPGPGQRTLTASPVDGLTGATTISVTASDGVYNTIVSFVLNVTPPSPVTAIFNNTNAINLPLAGIAAPYPSTNRVSGMPGLITNITLTLKGLTHSVPHDLEMLLVSPHGEKSVIFAHASAGALTNVNITLDDAATYALPPAPYAILEGTYRPANFGNDAFPTNNNAPGPAYTATMSAFTNASPNGDWRLFIMNDPIGTGAGSLTRGWSLAIYTDATNTAPTISAITNVPTLVNTPTAAVPFTMQDSSTAASNLVLSAFSSNTNLVTTNNIVFGGAGTNRTVTVTPSSNRLGSATITLTVNDGILSASTNFLLTVSPAPLTVTGHSTNRMYGATNFAFTGAIVGLQAGDNITATFTNAANTNSPLGIYTNTVTLLDPNGKLGNYVVTTNLGTLTVTNALLTVTANSISNKVYGTTLTLAKTNFTITSGILFNGNTLTNATLASTGTNAAAAVGSYPITITNAVGTGSANYKITYVTNVLTVTPVALTVAATSTNKMYGTNHTFAGTEFTITSGALLNGNTLTNVTLASAGTNVAAAVAAYPITVTNAQGLGLTNYTISYTDGTLTVTPAALTVAASDTNKVYGSTQVFAGTEFTLTSGTLFNGNTLTNVTLASAGSVSNAAVGSYAISASGALGVGLTNYTIGYSNGTLSVGEASLVITAGSTNKI